MSRAKKGVIITAILILLYGVFGFLIAPYILKSNLISGIAGQLGRNVTVNEVKVNPFVLSVTLMALRLVSLMASLNSMSSGYLKKALMIRLFQCLAFPSRGFT